MLGKQSGLDGGDHPYLNHVGRDSFYGFLALHRTELFQDEDFGGLYCSDNGRPSVPPSLLAMALLLQVHDGVSDEEAKARADFDGGSHADLRQVLCQAGLDRGTCGATGDKKEQVNT